MYKRISHNIVEEHFEHPATLPMSVVGACNTGTMYMGGFGGTGTTYQHVMQVPAGHTLAKIEKDSAIVWSVLSSRIRNLVISITSGDKDVDVLVRRVSGDIAKIGLLLVNAYDDNTVATFNRLLESVAVSLVGVITNINSGRDTSSSLEKLRSDTMAFAEFVSINPSWPVSVVNFILVSMEDLYIAQAKHRVNKEWAAAIDAADAAYDLIVVNQPNSYPSFSDIFAAGIFDANTKKQSM